MEQGRMRWAIWGPIIGFILLYFILRFAVNNFRADSLVLQDDHSVSTLQEVAIARSSEITATETTGEEVTGEATATEGEAAPDASGVVTETETVEASVITDTVGMTDTVAITDTAAMTGTDGMTETVAITGTESVTGTEVAAGEVAVDEATAEADEPGTVFVMQTLNGEAALGGWPVIAVVGGDGSITGSAGCNYYNASFTTEGDTVSVAVPTSTRMICASDAAMAQENAYLQALTQVTRFEQEDLALRLTGDDVEISFVSLEILYNLSWLVSELRDESGAMVAPLPDSAMTANFSLGEESVSGLDGCNNYEATFSVQGDLIIMDAPVVTPAGTSTVACEPGGEKDAQAQAFIAAMQDARLFDLSMDSLHFYDEGHELVLSFVPAAE